MRKSVAEMGECELEGGIIEDLVFSVKPEISNFQRYFKYKIEKSLGRTEFSNELFLLKNSRRRHDVCPKQVSASSMREDDFRRFESGDRDRSCGFFLWIPIDY